VPNGKPLIQGYLFSLRLSTKPASSQFLYGYERITFFSAGFEGAMMVVAAIA
jgi:divalent metal cation (Fe/Co/Zn/Cd) transporter